MSPWNLNNNNQNKTVHFEMNGNTETFEFEQEETLLSAVQTIAEEKGLTSVNVLVDGNEVNQSEGNKPLSDFEGRTLKVVPKNTGSKRG